MTILATTHATTQYTVKGMPLISVATVALVVALLLLLVFFYMLPSLVASKRHHRQVKAILIVNILLGWSFLGWVASLLWALTADVEDDEIPLTKRKKPDRTKGRLLIVIGSRGSAVPVRGRGHARTSTSPTAH